MSLFWVCKNSHFSKLQICFRLSSSSAVWEHYPFLVSIGWCMGAFGGFKLPRFCRVSNHWSKLPSNYKVVIFHLCPIVLLKSRFAYTSLFKPKWLVQVNMCERFSFGSMWAGSIFVSHAHLQMVSREQQIHRKGSYMSEYSDFWYNAAYQSADGDMRNWCSALERILWLCLTRHRNLQGHS